MISREPTDDERAVLLLWKEGLVAQDPRYEGKGLLKLAAVSMMNPEIRRRLLSDPERVLEDVRADYSLPEGVQLRFHENTADTLHVVLPAPGGGLDKRPAKVRDLLRSRTSEAANMLFLDDIDIGDWFDLVPGSQDRGDDDIRDSSNSGVLAVLEA